MIANAIQRSVLTWLIVLGLAFSVCWLVYQEHRGERFSSVTAAVGAVFAGNAIGWIVRRRFAEERRRAVRTAILTAAVAIIAGMVAVGKFEAVDLGHTTRKDLTEIIIGAAVFAMCISLSLRLFFPLRRSNPT